MPLSLGTQAVREKLRGLSRSTPFAPAKPLAGLVSFARPAGSADDEAVKVSLSKKRRPESARGVEEAEAAAGAKSKGVVGGLLEEIASITQQIRDLAKRQDGAIIGSNEREQLGVEIDALTNRYKDIVGGKEFKQILEISSQIDSMLQSGVSSSMIARGLQSASGLFGGGFISTIASGNISEFRNFSQGIGTLSDLSGQDLRDEGILSQIESAVQRAKGALSGSILPQLPEGREKKAAPMIGGDVPQLVTLPFAASGDVSLVVRTYATEDIIRAAQAHMPLDADTVISLAVNVDEEEEKEKAEKRREKRDDERLEHGQIESLEKAES